MLSLHENLHVSSCCLELLCSQYLVVVQVVICSEPRDVADLLHPPVGLGWESEISQLAEYKVPSHHSLAF